MNEDYTGQKLCIFIGEDDKYQGRVLYELLLEIALDNGLSGGTVIRGREGFGAHGEIRSMKILRLAENLPLILEFVGRNHKIAAQPGGKDSWSSCFSRYHRSRRTMVRGR